MNTDETSEAKLISNRSKIVSLNPSRVAVCTSHSPRGGTLSTLTHMNIILHEANGLQVGQRREDGYINLTKMAQASGKKINDYLRLDTTKAFIDELSMDTGIPASKLIEIRRGKPAYLQGTWGHPQVAVNCGQWCSAVFAVLVSKWVIDWLVIASNPIELAQTKLVQAYIESSQALNRLVHTAIHQQTNSLREALQACKTENESVIHPTITVPQFPPEEASVDDQNINPKSPKSKSSDCWYTPELIVKLILLILGTIDLDPCADDGKHIPAALHYTATDDGLNRDWHGRVFMNPPYSCPGVWMAKLQAEVESGRVKEAIALVPSATDTNWLSPVLKQQPVCFWKGRIKFLDVNYQPKLPARQSHVLVYWGENWERFQEVFDGYGFISVPASSIQLLLGDAKNSSSNSPSKVNLSPSKRQRGLGNGCIYWRTITKNGKDYPQAYYHWKENGKKRTKYIPKQLLGVVEDAEKQKRPVIEILELLGVGVSPSNNSWDEKNSPSNDEGLLGDKQANTAESIDITRFLDSPSNEISPSKRRKGDGSGSIHWRTITRGGKDYPQAYYHYEFWNGGDRLVKSSRYIPKKLLAQVQKMEMEKVPVREILGLLGVVV
ncbi:C-5 cytosine-specific DNA methylase (plasmid) [Calothrix sp. NIES-4101]|nr:C-5 cytosine-specific DNA methylase [Calothrix sp. NIES-4101]